MKGSSSTAKFVRLWLFLEAFYQTRLLIEESIKNSCLCVWVCVFLCVCVYVWVFVCFSFCMRHSDGCIEYTMILGICFNLVVHSLAFVLCLSRIPASGVYLFLYRNNCTCRCHRVQYIRMKAQDKRSSIIARSLLSWLEPTIVRHGTLPCHRAQKTTALLNNLG